ncbi:hypothetical protein MMC16_003710 [Acarospora aff. strigata]|nr:hypothetical protein [Acarospora aff. strigata]
MLASIWSTLIDVALFWQWRIFLWWTKKKPRDVLLDSLAEARSYEDWEEAAFKLDELFGSDLWRQNAASKYYDYRLIYERLQAIIEAREEQDILTLVSLLRSGLVRNLGNITAPRLFNRAYAGTKLLIEDYITQVALAIEYVTTLPTTPSHESGFTSQAKLDLLHDTRQAFGRSTLVLQGGAIFGLCHLGVVKALHLRGLLPRIITGTATGALIAALVGIHTEEELLDFVNGDGIDLTAFARHQTNGLAGKSGSDNKSSLLRTLLRRMRRFVREGYFLDMNILEECVRANVGDMTFEEAYAKTKRVLNITVATSGRSGVPNLLNYLTAPNVLIWSAALASNATTTSLYHPVTLLCKDPTGTIIPWASAQGITFRPWRHARHTSDRDSPLSRIAELFNVNHFIVSQARPYIAPFLRSDTHHRSPHTGGTWTTQALTTPFLRLIALELHHRLHQLDSLSLLPITLRRLLIDETIPGASITLVPELTPADLLKLLENPTHESLQYWILRGERSVWPAVGALKVRCAVEGVLDRGYQVVRRRKPLDVGAVGRAQVQRAASGEGKRRRRAVSVGLG